MVQKSDAFNSERQTSFCVPGFSEYPEKTFDSVVRHECSIITAHCTPKFVNGHFVLRNMRLLATIARALSIVFEKRSLLFIGRSGTTTEISRL